MFSKRINYFLITSIFSLASFFSCQPTQAQDGTATEIIFTKQKKEEAREQLRRLLSEYDLDPWIVTQEVRIEAGVDPHSTPILTLNARHLDDDKMQLSIFLHEQAHLLPLAKREAAAQDLRELYPEIPALPKESQIPEEEKKKVEEFKQSTYNHIVVAWVELDAMTELVGEAEAREILKEKVQNLTEKPYSTLEKSFVWYNNRVLENPQEIGAILANHDLNFTPEKGLVVESKGK